MEPTRRLVEWANSNAIVTTTTIILAPELEALLRINIPFVGSAVIGDSGTLVCWLAKGGGPSRFSHCDKRRAYFKHANTLDCLRAMIHLGTEIGNRSGSYQVLSELLVTPVFLMGQAES
jgi:hypothetical protein